MALTSVVDFAERTGRHDYDSRYLETAKQASAPGALTAADGLGSRGSG
ncbi:MULTISPECIES: hypothetical protein [unclassified Streptomyces]|nr:MULTISPECIES: hypothetical protein [unclassified Streptomyces]SCF87483.1 hypothetical protein GA0115259_1040111 [Streptomyces sp. MnatMP-M17]